MEWWEKPLRIVDIGLPEFKLEKIEEAVTRKKELHFNCEHFGPFGYDGGEKGIFYFKSSVADTVPLDLLGEYLRSAHKEGIKVIIYFNVHWLSPKIAEKHKDWAQLRRDGSMIDDVYGLGMSPCVNSPDYRRWSFQVIRDLAQYDIDGIFLDGPIFIASGCYCQACREKFKRSYGKELPIREDWEDQTWKEFIEFRYDSITDYMRDASSTLKGIKPEAIIYMNGQGLWPSWPNGRDNRRLAPYQDIIGAEGGFIGGDLTKVSLWKPAMSAKLLETQANGKPTVIFIAGKNCGWDHYALTPAETKLLYADTIAHGASPWYGEYYANIFDPGAEAAGEMNKFIEENEEYLEKTTSVAKVALMWSIKTADYYRATVPVTDFTQEGERLTKYIRAGDHFKAFTGYFEVLTRSHIPFDVLDEKGIEEKLKEYEVLILPNVACISNHTAEIIKEWVKNGGILIATFETSFYDEWGNKRSEPVLSELFGVNIKGIEGPCNLDYFDRGEGPLFERISTKLIPSPKFRIKSQITSGKVLALYREKFPARYQPLPPLSDHPAIVENKYGDGRILYFCGNIDEAYLEFHFPEHRELMVRLIELFSTPLIITNAPETVEISIRKQDSKNRIILHLINFTGEMTRPMNRTIPIYDIVINLPWIKDTKKVILLSEKREVNHRLENGLSFTVPKLDVYEAIAIE
ncbi:MAG: beta-galactosidase trimerization domain-containing protein [bacterium]|nr:beta-galactosidase trimerization domain-containing protein [bacterium]